MKTPDLDDWDAHWAQFAEAASRNPAQIYRHATLLRLLAEPDGHSPARLLDVGSGQGDFMVKAAHAWPEAALCGFEMSATGVEMTRRKLPGAQALVVDLFRPQPEAAPYRAWATHAVCSEVLEHVDDPAAFLRAAHEYLADGARLIVTVPGGPMSAYDRHIGHRRHFTRASIARYLEEGGFRPERVLMAGFPFFNLYRLTVIARGEKLARDVRASDRAPASSLAERVMGVFRFLFRFNRPDSRFGWQVVAVARKISP